MKENFGGIGIDATGSGISFSSEDDHYKLDGIKIERVILGGSLCSQRDVDHLIDFLKILKYSFPNIRQYSPTPDECYEKPSGK